MSPIPEPVQRFPRSFLLQQFLSMPAERCARFAFRWLSAQLAEDIVLLRICSEARVTTPRSTSASAMSVTSPVSLNSETLCQSKVSARSVSPSLWLIRPSHLRAYAIPDRKRPSALLIEASHAHRLASSLDPGTGGSAEGKQGMLRRKRVTKEIAAYRQAFA